MKTTFTEFHLGDTVDTNGRKQIVKGKAVDVTRFDIEAFVSDDPNYPPMTRLLFWIASGESYSIMLSGAPMFPIEMPAEKELIHGTADDKTIRSKT